MTEFFDDIFLLMDGGDSIKERCLISHDVLEDKHITLECGHKFNYKNIFNEVVKQKTYFNSCETQKLSIKQIKCPYCRNVQNKLIPLFDEYNSIKGVNSPLKHCMFLYKCEFVYIKGKKKGQICETHCNEKYCRKHLNVTRCLGITKQNKQCTNFAKDNNLCSLHKKIVV